MPRYDEAFVDRFLARRAASPSVRRSVQHR
jgi:hypothetical protein